MRILDSLAGGVSEIMRDPGYADPELIACSNYAL